MSCKCGKSEGVNVLVKAGKYPISKKLGVDYKRVKHYFSRKLGQALWGPGTARPNHRYNKVKFDFWVKSPETGVFTNTFLFAPEDLEIV